METLKSIADYNNYFNTARQWKGTIGFVPTMGALHKGHLSLIERAKDENDKVVCSIFVNPTQFNDPNDFNNYPRDIATDILKLESRGCDAVFIPTKEEMYPENANPAKTQDAIQIKPFDLGHLGTTMEGAYRTGHFDGVINIVQRLFNIVKPDFSYFGKKDFQQLVVIRTMAEKLNYPTKIIGCPIIRESDGLAMSSRNQLLSKHAREGAPLIYRTLCAANEKKKDFEPTQLKNWIKEQIDSHPALETEYVEICHLRTLLPLYTLKDRDPTICCLAVYADGVRLIDNIVLFN